MSRKYVIIKRIDTMDFIVDPEEPIVDIVSTMTRADEICAEMEEENPGFIYYWREVISSED